MIKKLVGPSLFTFLKMARKMVRKECKYLSKQLSCLSLLVSELATACFLKLDRVQSSAHLSIQPEKKYFKIYVIIHIKL